MSRINNRYYIIKNIRVNFEMLGIIKYQLPMHFVTNYNHLISEFITPVLSMIHLQYNPYF